MMKTLIYVTSLLFLCMGTIYSENATQDAGRESSMPLTVYRSDQDGLLTCEISLSLQEKPAESVRHLLIAANQSQAILPLYPVFLRPYSTGGDVHCIFRLPKSSYDLLKQGANNTNICLRGTRFFQQEGRAAITFVNDQAGFAKATRAWEAGFKADLTRILATYEDTEFETLLYMRFFGSIPKERPDTWKNEDVLKVIFCMSGLNDIRDAIPLNEERRPDTQPYTEPPPKPILIPQVSVPQVEAPEPGLAKWVPRSCYYLEWSSFRKLEAALSFAAANFDKWSPGTYPESMKEIVKTYRKKLGLTEDYCRKNLENNVDTIALAGWDLYFQSGTSVMVVIKSKKPIKPPESAPFSATPEANIMLLANSKKLLDMAQKAYTKKHSLSQQNNFIYSRKRLVEGKGEQEAFFLYLSDYWLTNYISPRWMIQTNRLAQLDARIRFVNLLKICRMYEQGLKALPSLKEVAANSSLSAEIQTWLFRDLEEVNGVIRDKALGGLYDHPAVDQLSFDKVTKDEKEWYERFRNRYMSRWRQMDPIAFQVVKIKDDLYKTRLYISPISNQSDFRSLLNFIKPNKPKHVMRIHDGQAVGLSIAVPSEPLKGFGILSPMPLYVFIQLSLYDFAPSSYSPQNWFKAARAYDSSSYMRLPIALSTSTVFLNALSPLIGARNTVPSDYKGIEVVQGIPLDSFYPLMRLNKPKDGIAYLGLDPSTLVRIRDSSLEKLETDPVSCDLRLYANFVQGFQLRRKLWFEALKNRGLASWRRKNRIYRIEKMFSSSETNRFYMRHSENITKSVDSLKQCWLITLKKHHIFPTEIMVVSDSVVQQIPVSKEEKEEPYSRMSNLVPEAKNLPSIMLNTIQADTFVSVEQSGLFFENHLTFAAKKSSPATTPSATTPPTQNNQPETQLDFDN